jgi:phosphoribosylaminoimidazolecarboxamide formyltransferase / IMP cyclohydrolase
MSLRALLAPHDKTGLTEFARGLRECGVELVATDGTRRELAAAGIEAGPVSALTGLPEMLDGRVKTLHPAVHAGILARRDVPAHLAQLAEHGFVPIDIVAVSLYPFREAVAEGAPREEIVERIDIGGPTLIRGAAKNAASVAVVVSPAQYAQVLAELRAHGGVSEATRRRLAAEAFAHVAAYDTAVAAWLASQQPAEAMPAELTVGGARLAELRYGENPHQRGALYAVPGPPGGLAHARRLQGPALSFTNWLDADAARRIVGDFTEPAAVIVKHTNPCGFATGADLCDAYRRAYACDPRAAYGGVVGVNRPLDPRAAAEITSTFLEVLVTGEIEPGAEEVLGRRQRMRVLAVDRPAAPAYDVRSVDGGLLVQTPDEVSVDRASMQVVTRRPPTEAEWSDLLVAVRLCRHVKSNAIVVVRDGMGVGVGAGQMSRVEAAELAVARAGEAARGAAAASDAFFPFADGLEVLGRAGASAVIQPGGSRRDSDVVAAADALGMAMVLTGERHFRH